LYTLPDIIRVFKPRRMRWRGHIPCMRKMRNAYKILVGKPDRKRTHRRSKCRWGNNT